MQTQLSGWYRCLWAVLTWAGVTLSTHSVGATDFFLTIGGGYRPEGNQASLEANVLFYQRILKEKHPGPRVHDLFFADGNDPGKDLQIEAPPQKRPDKPLTELLTALHRRGPPQGSVGWFAYRDHKVPNVSGANDPELVKKALDRIAATTRKGDRLIVYVTAHGDEADDEDTYNTSITGWNETEIRMRELTERLDKFSPDIPVVLVMAQCYCGGFTQAIYRDADPEQGLSPAVRAGFFAQQHNLPAAGCRPDIENDAEYSSYFWGAMMGVSRNGKPMPGCDADGNGEVSFDEAHAHAIIAAETIDIPIKASDMLLRQFSRIPDYTLAADRARQFRESDDDSSGESDSNKPADPVHGQSLHKMTGTIESLLIAQPAATRRTVTALCDSLGLKTSEDVSQALSALQTHRRTNPFREPGGRGFGPGRRSGRRELLAAISEKWPELGDPEKWKESTLVKDGDQAALVAEIKKLPAYEDYEQRRLDREKQAANAEQHELKGVKYRRLIDTLESIVLDKNLPQVAPPEICDGYAKMRNLEGTSLKPRP
jgi:hypothetical protein